MKQAFSEGATNEQLASHHHLAIETIKKIVYVKKGKELLSGAFGYGKNESH